MSLFRSLNALKIPYRTMSSAAAEITATPYPFSKTAIIHPKPFTPPPKPIKEGKGLMEYLYKTLPPPNKQQVLRTLFSRHSPNRLLPGSIVKVDLEHSPDTFTGVLLAIRRRGPDTSFLLRNIIHRTAVEMQFFVGSPHVKKIQVLQKANKGTGSTGAKRIRRAKLYYLRDSPQKMSQISAAFQRK